MKEEKEKFKTKLQKLLKNPIESITTITDLEDRYFNMEPLEKEELRALKNYEKYRVQKLKDSKNQKKFNKNFARLQVLSNIADYKEFLKSRYEV